MAKKIVFTCILPNGIHARPATTVERACKDFKCSIEWYNLRTNIKGDAKSVLSLISTNTLLNDECHLVLNGYDEELAFEKLNLFIKNEFPFCDEELKSNINDEVLPIPRSLSNLHPNIIRGNSVCSGRGKGILKQVISIDLNNFTDFKPVSSIENEQKLVRKSLSNIKKIITAQINYESDTSKDILSAHLAILEDVSFFEKIEEGINNKLTAGKAIIDTYNFFSEQLINSGSEYLKERVLDIRDVCFQLLQQVYGDKKFPTNQKLKEPSICLADELTPSQFLELDKKYLKGLLLTHGGTTSHTIILARSFNIPTLVGVNTESLTQYVGQEIQIDGDLGLIAYHLSEEVIRYYNLEDNLHTRLIEKQKVFTNVPGATIDGSAIEVAANIAHSIEALPAFNNGAESVGLFRTEMLYMDRHNEPSEDELYNTFCQALEVAKNRSIIIRTFDIGGDKPVDYLKIPTENNPFLGYRAVRIYQEYLTLFRTQLRAILRASAHGNLKIMIPMISSMEEILWIKEELTDIKQSLRSQKIPFDEKIQLGIMLEVPSIMFIIDQCCEEIDFFSIGSNDLTQYLLAVDRDNAKVIKHYNSLNPAFLRGLDHIVKTVHHYGKWVGICGELAGKGSVLPLLVGLGFDELSMSAPNILSTKARLAKLNRSECRILLNKAMACRTSLEVEHLLAQFRMEQGDLPLITKEIISIDPDWISKEEVIKGMTDNLLATERCRYPKKLEEDIWKREDVFSTALGFGFAIPHTKSEHIEQSSISVTKLSKPILWGEEEVTFIIMLTLNKHVAGDQHMRIFSKLARRIMHDEFRDPLTQSFTVEEIESFLKKELDI